MPATVKQLKFNGSAEVLSKYAENDTKGRKISTLFDQMQSTIDDLKAVGRFLSVWNAKTGLPETNPPGSAPYEYHYVTGDYFIVGITDDPKDYPAYQTNVSYQVGDQCSYDGDYYICNTATSGSWTSAAWTQHVITNYKPSGTIYTGAASSTVESNPVKANDFYRYDGNGGWIWVASTPRTVTFEEIAGNPSDNTALNSALNRKLDKNSQNDLIMQNPGGSGYRSIYFYNGLSSSYLSYIRGSGGTDNLGTGSYLEIVSPNLKIGRSGTARAILATDGLGSDRTYQFPNKNGTFAMTSDIPTVNNPTITVQKNGSTVDTFSLNQSFPKTVNITMSKSDVGLGNVDNKSEATIKADFTGAIANGNTGFVTGDMIYDNIVYEPDFYENIDIRGVSDSVGLNEPYINFYCYHELSDNYSASPDGKIYAQEQENQTVNVIVECSGGFTIHGGIGTSGNHTVTFDTTEMSSDITVGFPSESGTVLLDSTGYVKNNDIEIFSNYYDGEYQKITFVENDGQGGTIEYGSISTRYSQSTGDLDLQLYAMHTVAIFAPDSGQDDGRALLSTHDLTQDRYFQFPDKAGTLAMTSDIPPITADDYTLEV